MLKTDYVLKERNNIMETESVSVVPVESCSVTGKQNVEICLPVTVKPFAIVGKIITRCCEEVQVTQGINICEESMVDECNFTISQKICVEVPVEFGADVKTGETHIKCNASQTNDLVFIEK